MPGAAGRTLGPSPSTRALSPCETGPEQGGSDRHSDAATSGKAGTTQRHVTVTEPKSTVS